MTRSKKSGDSTSFLDERTRAEDILLGGLGFDTDVVFVSVRIDDAGFYRGQAKNAEGELFDYVSEDPATNLDRWAVQVLNSNKSV